MQRLRPPQLALEPEYQLEGQSHSPTEVRKAVREESPGCETLTTMCAAWSRQDFLQKLSCSARSLGERPGMRQNLDKGAPPSRVEPQNILYGGGGIRTHEGLRPPVFKTGALDRSATPPQRKMDLTSSYFN